MGETTLNGYFLLKVPIVVKFINEFIVLISTTVNKSLRLVKDDSKTTGKAWSDSDGHTTTKLARVTFSPK